MKQIELKSLELTNFKGIRSFKLNADGANVNVFGDNATGKTTIFDAFTWLLFDKDSADSNKFQLKTVDAEGNELHYLDHSVEAKLSVNGSPKSLKKVYHEKWTTKKGNTQKEFSGHTADYFLDDVPVSKSEFDETVRDLIRVKNMKGTKSEEKKEIESLFKTMTSPLYFNAQVPWKGQRKMLLKVCGGYTDDEIIASKKELAALPNILNGRSTDDYVKIISNRQKLIKEETEKIPIQIKENDRMKAESMGSVPLDQLEISAESLQKQIDEIDNTISDIRAGGEADKLRKEILKLEGEQQQIRNDFQSDELRKADEKNKEYYDFKSEHDRSVHQLDLLNDEITVNKKNINRLEANREDARHEWFAADSEKFEFNGETTCPTCGQELPPNQIADAEEIAQKEFNLHHAEKMEAIQKKGSDLKDRSESLQEETKALEEKANELVLKIEGLKNSAEDAKRQRDEIKDGIGSVFDLPKFQENRKKILSLEEEIEELQQSVKTAVAKQNEKKYALKKQLATVESEINRFDDVHKYDARIAELNAEEKRLAKENERMNYEADLIEQFMRAKVSMLEERINSHFKLARFKLFEDQVNGGLNEICEATYQGVPFNALNNAARINVGLDIIQTLSGFYGLSAPIFIDNREAVTRLIDIDAQIISLIVSEKDKQLRVEQEERSIEEAII
jgi:DNA repair exonuclease SbcCD ATPase subunit